MNIPGVVFRWHLGQARACWWCSEAKPLTSPKPELFTPLHSRGSMGGRRCSIGMMCLGMFFFSDFLFYFDFHCFCHGVNGWRETKHGDDVPWSLSLSFFLACCLSLACSRSRPPSVSYTTLTHRFSARSNSIAGIYICMYVFRRRRYLYLYMYI